MYKYIQPLFVISQSKNNIYAILIYTYTRDYANFVRKSNIEYERKRVINNIYLFSVKIVNFFTVEKTLKSMLIVELQMVQCTPPCEKINRIIFYANIFLFSLPSLLFYFYSNYNEYLLQLLRARNLF